MDQTCPCVKKHSPKPVAFQVHHIVPTGWGGKNVPENKVTICGTCHDNTHTLLNLFVHSSIKGETPPLAEVRKFPKFSITLAYKAIAGVGGSIPRVFTMPALPEDFEDATLDTWSDDASIHP